MTKIEILSLASLAQKIRGGELKCAQVASRFVENIEKHANLNAFITFDKNSVLAEARQFDKRIESGESIRGRLFGVPLVIKDNIHVKNLPNTVGCVALKRFVPLEDADVVKTLRNEGCLILGKSNLDEFFIDLVGDNRHFGPIRNPYDSSFSAGGSSGGTACAIASNQAPAGLGSDTGGSIRIPSSVNGVFGLRPTVGRYSNRGMTPMSPTFDTIGPMAKSIEDLDFLDEIITGEKKLDSKFKELRIGIPKGYLTVDLDPEIESAFEEVKNSLSRNGVKLIEVEMNEIQKASDKLSMIISTYESTSEFERYLNEYKTGVSLEQVVEAMKTPFIKSKFQTFIVSGAPRAIRKSKYDECMNVIRPRLQREYQKMFDSNSLNALVYPSLVCKPVKFDDLKGAETMWLLARNTLMTINTGVPSLTMSMGKTKTGLPIGLQLDGLWKKDKVLLNIAANINQYIS